MNTKLLKSIRKEIYLTYDLVGELFYVKSKDCKRPYILCTKIMQEASNRYFQEVERCVRFYRASRPRKHIRIK
jgi:hypothetical protein